MAKRLGIHVIGPRYGESVVVELPDGGVGIIDSFATGAAGRHPVVEFIRKQYPGLTELRFFAVTHPHADHCFRAAEVYDAFKPKEVWIFKPFPLGQVTDYYKALLDHGSPDEVELALGFPAGSVADSLLQFEDRVCAPIINRRLPYRPLVCDQTFSVCSGSVTVHFLTPGGRQQLQYSAQLGRALKALTDDGRVMAPAGGGTAPDHNLASTGVLIQYGKSRVLLMADAEDRLWEEWFEVTRDTDAWRPIQFIKAAHHGSDNGHHARLYSELADPTTTVAVVTPFNHGRVHLPTADGIRALRPAVKELYCTNRHTAESSTSLRWDAINHRPLPPVPSSWVKRVVRAPTLGGLLVARAWARAPAGGRQISLPAEWVADAVKTPDLWHLIRPEYRQPVPGLVPAEDYVVSAFLDNKGRILDLRCGYEAGLLNL